MLKLKYRCIIIIINNNILKNYNMNKYKLDNNNQIKDINKIY